MSIIAYTQKVLKLSFFLGPRTTKEEFLRIGRICEHSLVFSCQPYSRKRRLFERACERLCNIEMTLEKLSINMTKHVEILKEVKIMRENMK